MEHYILIWIRQPACRGGRGGDPSQAFLKMGNCSCYADRSGLSDVRLVVNAEMILKS